MANTKMQPWQDPHVEPYLCVENAQKSYGGYPALNYVDLDIYKGEFFCLLGPSGCGKTSLLRAIAGFETLDSGSISIDGTNMIGTPPYKRPVNMMFQSYALFPHMTVEQNIAFGIQQENVPKSEITDRVQHYLRLVQMQRYATRKPDQLSGGQRQRVALARSLIKRPKVVLLDEPLAALDKVLRRETQFELVNIQEQIGVTFVMVTHDQEEAMTMASRIAIMEDGRIRQIGTPQEIYEYPNSCYVADFIGTMNIFSGVVSEDLSDFTVVRCPDLGADIKVEHSSQVPIGSQVDLAMRPEKVVMLKELPDDPELNCLRGKVEEIAYQGDLSIYHIILPTGAKILATMPNLFRISERPVTWEDEVYLCWHPENALILAA